MLKFIKELFSSYDLNNSIRDIELSVLKEKLYRLELHNSIYRKQLQFLQVPKEIIDTPEIMIGYNNGLSEEVLNWVEKVKKERK